MSAPARLRPAAPTIQEGLAFAGLLEQAQEGMFRAMLGPRVIDIVAQAFIRSGHELSHEHVLFAERDGRIVGMVAAYTAEAQRHFSSEPLRTAAGLRRYRMAAFMRFNRRGFGFMATLADGDCYVRALAVDPDSRGGGLGTLLLTAAEERARAAGATALALDVAAKNRAAQRLYRRFGLTVLDESPKWLGLPNTNLLRMSKPLPRPG